MAASDLVSFRGQVMEYPYISKGIKREMVRYGVDCQWKGQVIGTVGRGPVAIHSSGQTILVAPFINSPVMPSLSCVHKHLLSSFTYF